MKNRLVLFAFCLFIMASNAGAADGLVSIKSPYSTAQTANRFEAIINKKGLTLFSRINHQSNAQGVELELRGTELFIFGNPKIGTLVMQCAHSAAIDFPQKVLIWEDEEKQTWLSYNNPEYIKKRHKIKGCDQVMIKISNVLKSLTSAAVAVE